MLGSVATHHGSRVATAAHLIEWRLDGGLQQWQESLGLAHVHRRAPNATDCSSAIPTHDEREREGVKEREREREVGRGRDIDRDEGEGGETKWWASPSPEKMVERGRGYRAWSREMWGGTVPSFSLSLFTRLGHVGPVLNLFLFFFYLGTKYPFCPLLNRVNSPIYPSILNGFLHCRCYKVQTKKTKLFTILL